ncbi:MAG: hypothetical protein A2506_05710 [Elusimicrobia bacterium RIFOXYD12_FULL_66_9]|nr:MAG: hypothetical protein A2506_05710 [Elusimicrobia bacterium RIFOXYD12_FULL_66_9]
MIRLLPKDASAVSLTLAAAAILLPLSLGASNLALGALSLALLWRMRRTEQRKAVFGSWRGEPAWSALILYAAAGSLASSLGSDMGVSAHDCIKDLHRLWSLSLFVAALTLEPEAPLWPAFASGFALAAAVGIAQSAFLPSDGTSTILRAHAYVHPVTYGEQMAFAALGGLCWLRRPSTPDTRAWRWAMVVTILCAAALALSQTRAALLAICLGSIAVAILEPRLRRWAAAAIALGSLSAIAGHLNRYGTESAATFIPREQQTRLALWHGAWRMFRDHPWTGVGPGHFRTQFTSYFSGTIENQSPWGTAHNLYLHQAAERGLVGVAALAGLFAVLLWRSWRAGRARSDAASLWAFAAVTAFLIMNITETAFQNEQLATLFLLVWAFGTARRSGKGAEIL